MASTGQYILHRWQIWQASGYFISAFPFSFKRITSVGHVFTHIPQPMQPFILLIAMIFCVDDAKIASYYHGKK